MVTTTLKHHDLEEVVALSDACFDALVALGDTNPALSALLTNAHDLAIDAQIHAR